MKAVEFYKKITKGEKEREIVKMHMQDDFFLSFAEAYHKAEFKRKMKKINKQHAKDIEETYQSAREDGFYSSSL